LFPVRYCCAFHGTTLMRAFLFLTFAAFAGLMSDQAVSAPRKTPAARNLSMEAVNNAEWRGKSDSTSTALLVKLQILLDRADASPGQIDATRGENTRKAVVAYREMRGLPGGEKIDEQLWTLIKNDQQPALVTYTIAEKDTAGPWTIGSA
jgi:peptidoglycan hydrolase-like protein with peptidoglycan-binding domain